MAFLVHFPLLSVANSKNKEVHYFGDVIFGRSPVAVVL